MSHPTGLITCSQLASIDVKHGRWLHALQLLTIDLAQQGWQLDCRAGSLVVKSCSLGRHWVKALKLLHSARSRSPGAFDVVLCSATLDAAGKGLAWSQVLGVFDLISTCGLQANVITCNAAISCFQHTRLWQFAAAFIEEISKKRVQCLGTTFDAAVGALGSHVWKEALGCMSKASERGLSRRVIATNTAIRSAASSGVFSWSWCVALLDDADLYGWTSAISGCILASHWEIAEELAFRLRMISLEPGIVTSNAIIGAREANMSARSPWEVCMQHLHEQSDAVTCSSLTTAGTVAKQWDQAMTMVGVMRQQGVVLDGIAWSATVAACAAGLQWPGALQMAMQTVSASTPSDLSGAVASTVLGCAHWRAAMMIWTWAAVANLEPDANPACQSAFLRSISTHSWKLSLFLSAMGHDEVSKQASAAESLVQCLVHGGSYRSLLQQLLETRRTGLELLAYSRKMENTPEQWYKNLPLLTRISLTVFFCTTVFVQLGFLDPMLIALNWPMVINKLQVWRLLTPVAFFGTFSFQFLFQMYFFSSFSSKLEQNEAFAHPGDYLFFLLLQIVLLDVISLALAWPSGFPFLGPSLVFAILYYWSRREPYAKLSFFSFSIQGYQFPFALLFFQLLIGGNIWMDLLGLASGHIYYFLHEVVPQEYGYTLIKTPAALTNFMARQTGRSVPQAAQQQRWFQGRGHSLGGN